MPKRRRYSDEEISAFTEALFRDGYCVLRRHLPQGALEKWNESFGQLLSRHVASATAVMEPARHRVTLPFTAPYADPGMYENEDVLAVVTRMLGDDVVLGELAVDAPVLGSELQEVKRGVAPLFPEMPFETPAFQLAVEFPLVDVTEDNGPLEIAKGTHCLTRAEGLRRLERGETRLEPVLMRLGDVMIRDVRGLHRGTPNTTASPRPVVVLGYCRRWLHRPDVSIRIPRAAVELLTPRARQLLRFSPIVAEPSEDAGEGHALRTRTLPIE